LERSAESFDSGYEDEAQRLATVIRVLVHDTRASHSLLGQLGVKDAIQWIDTALPIMPENLLPTPGLVVMRFTGGAETTEGRYAAPLNVSTPPRLKPDTDFAQWWTTANTKDGVGTLFNRKDFILTVANKEGGAHVDAELDPTWVALTRDNSIGFRVYAQTETGEEQDLGPFKGNVAFASVRQIAYEVTETLKRDLSHFLDPVGGIPSPVQLRQAQRNDPCPCGSGKKLKKCHGATAI
jgi:hypothetical protein